MERCRDLAAAVDELGGGAGVHFHYRAGEYPGVLRNGSTGTAVRELQFYLYLMSAYQSSIPSVSIDAVSARPLRPPCGPISGSPG